jgi:hypothetical protein
MNKSIEQSKEAFEKYERDVKDFTDYELRRETEGNMADYAETEAQFDWQLWKASREKALLEAISICEAAMAHSESKFYIKGKIQELIK